MKEFAEEAHSLGIWDGGSSPSFAISSSGAASLNRSISRKNTNDVFLKYADENSLPESVYVRKEMLKIVDGIVEMLPNEQKEAT